MEGKPDPFGRDAIRPLDIPVRGWWQVAERVLSESSRDNLSVVAAGCALRGARAAQSFSILPERIYLHAFGYPRGARHAHGDCLRSDSFRFHRLLD